MAENPPQAANDNDSASSESDSSEESYDSSMDSSSELEVCFQCKKLKLPEHIAAYCEKRELIRDNEPICDNEKMEEVMTNYIIAKKILSHLCWQDRMLCKHVCSTWRSAVNALAKEQMNPVDFIYDTQRKPWDYDKLIKSDTFHNEPLAVLSFVNTTGLTMTVNCKNIFPCPCATPCKDEGHALLDVLNQRVCAPKNCMLTVVASYLTYMPLPASITSPYAIRHYQYHMPRRLAPFIGGLYIPKIPDVEFHILNIRQKNRNTIDFETAFYDVVTKLAETRIFKGVLMYVTEYYTLQSVGGVMLQNYFKGLQPDIPYALAGCIIEDTVIQENGIANAIKRINDGCMEFASDNLISLGVFTVPKTEDGNTEKYNFEMFSLVIEKSEWSKVKIQEIVNDFARKVPHFKHSVALKLSCVGRDKKHEVEQEYFRAAFPDTPLVGCYGNGELGINHPARPEPNENKTKRARRDSPRGRIMYSYSTVFMYIGWGKIINEPTPMETK